jgi:sporulation protein YlmC with PRC-barrel domain
MPVLVAGRSSGKNEDCKSRDSGMPLLRRFTMKIVAKSFCLISVFMLVLANPGLCQTSQDNLNAKVDEIVLEAYKSVSTAFPCKLKAGGKPKMLSWQAIEKCFFKAYNRIDWEGVSQKLKKIREEGRYQRADVYNAVEAALTARALKFDEVFTVKNEIALLPLSNSLLRSLPEESLINLPVYDKSGKQIGTFSGNYIFEKMGDISGNLQKYSLFQYTDANGKIHSSSDRLLLDSFGVPWKDAKLQRGFRLSSEKMMPKH